MKARTYMSTDWIEVHEDDSTYLARIFLTDNDEAYMIVKTENKTRFFKVGSELLRSDELGFFEKVMEGAEELPSMPISLDNERRQLIFKVSKNNQL